MMRHQHALVVLLAVTTTARAQGSSRDIICIPLALAATVGTSVELPDSIGVIRLGRGTVVSPLGTNPHGRHLVLEDSTVLDVWVTPQPAGGLAASGGMRARGMRRCETRIGRYPATVTRVELWAPNRAPVFVGIVNLVLSASQAVNLALTTATANSRDTMLGRVAASLQFRSQ